ncbi:toll/interleukin-1 receptor domain-containing protein [Spirosoma rhododendri]|uniref:Toll/interleukin-1 receptor domain-containing protein n=1 Tax=Spirosoma rhododendri TaxID=2728024 RepID=A0A7L5DU53_9BACT|nr:toll/interleukin-1 receptor domain-containing protein [Spirosoma rhododendri]QJD81152.1 toll/interleukin-1 receptor domain-containing protein [Spirosoma rhododendri]
MAAAYQIVLLGDGKKEELRYDIVEKIRDIGLDLDDHVAFLDASNVKSRSRKYPTVCVFFGSDNLSDEDIETVNCLVKDEVIVIPVVMDLTLYSQLTPPSLHPINGSLLSERNGGISAVSNAVLETLNLLRRTRKLFISYRRQESSAVAIQLYEYLHRNGFDVFIDTISIRPGEPFQEVLWHRLSDTDVVVLLDTPGFLESRWTRDELANTSAMSIGILQLIWPGHTPDPKSSLCEKYYLEDSDFAVSNNGEKNILTDSCIQVIGKNVENLRARSLASRYTKLVGTVGKIAEDLGIELTVQPERYAIIKKNGKYVAVIPTVGIPEALRYQEIAELFEAIRDKSISDAYLLYDHVMLRDKWRKHLDWLDNHLPVKSVKVFNAELWLNTL